MTLNQGTHFVLDRTKNVEDQPETMILLEKGHVASNPLFAKIKTYCSLLGSEILTYRSGQGSITPIEAYVSLLI